MLQNKGLSSCAVSRLVNISQPSCYYMMMKFRHLFSQDYVLLSGDEVAVDEIYVGGTFSKMPLSKRQFLTSKFKLPTNPRTTKEKIAIANKVNSLYMTPVIGINSGSSLVLKVVPNSVSQSEIVALFHKHVSPDSHIVSDYSTLYNN